MQTEWLLGTSDGREWSSKDHPMSPIGGVLEVIDPARPDRTYFVQVSQIVWLRREDNED